MQKCKEEQASSPMFDAILEKYIREKSKSQDEGFSEDDLGCIVKSLKDNILQNELFPLAKLKMEREEKQKIDEQAKKYKEKIYSKLEVTIIVETIFIAFLVGLIVNQVTNWLDGCFEWQSAVVVIISLIICTLIVIVGTAKAKRLDRAI